MEIDENKPLEETPEIPQTEAPAQDVTEEKPKRGRKPKDAPDATVIPRKSKKKKEEEKDPETPKTGEFFAQQIYGIHQLASVMTGIDLSITPESAQQLGQAVYEVVKEYDLSWMSKFSPLINLAVTAAIVEAPVIMKAQKALAQKAAIKKEQVQLKKDTAKIESGEPLKNANDPLSQAGDIIGGGMKIA